MREWSKLRDFIAYALYGWPLKSMKNIINGIAVFKFYLHTYIFQMNFLKLSLKTVVVFVICWLPFSTCNLMKASNYSCGGKDVEFSLFTLAFFNSVLNPFVYFTHTRKVLRKSFLTLRSIRSTYRENSRIQQDSSFE